MAPLITVLLLLGVYLETRAMPDPVLAERFHAVAKAAVDGVPQKIGSFEGIDTPIPPAAQALLRPNALLSRAYINRSTGRTGNFIIVQCKDTRDMGGHYPPVCYPAHGWQRNGIPSQDVIAIEGTEIPITRYEFNQAGFERNRSIVIYNFFALPGVGLVPDIDRVRTAAGDYRSRPFGAAQVQVVLDSGFPRSEEEAIFTELVGANLSVIQSLASDPEASSK
ncbi:MAG: exosortase-associated EpsI family protein [Phycisphaerales bacterium]|nr:exosortase-associated EpsI family protein [Phycisphaerales bacterium]